MLQEKRMRHKHNRKEGRTVLMVQVKKEESISPYYICVMKTVENGRLGGRETTQTGKEAGKGLQSVNPQNKFGSAVVCVMTKDEIKKHLRQGAYVKIVGTEGKVEVAQAIAKAEELVPLSDVGVVVEGSGAVCTPWDVHRSEYGEWVHCLREDFSEVLPPHFEETFCLGGIVTACMIDIPSAAFSLDRLRKKYVVIMATAQKLQQQMAELEEELQQLSAEGNGTPPFNIFNPVVDENKLADCFYRMYADFFGPNKTTALDGDCDETDFAAYLFLLVAKEGLGKDNFVETAKKPFFEFIQAKVIINLNKTDRTFRNRLDGMDNLCKQVLKGRTATGSKAVQTGTHHRNFHKVLGNFHETPYYRGLEKLLREGI